MPNHRHLVVGPMFVLILTLCVAPGIRSVFAPGGEDLKEDDGSREIYAADGRETFEIDGHILMGIGGLFFASNNGEILSVAAISTPVLVRSETGVILVPVSMQWREGERFQQIPTSFLRDHLAHDRANDLMAMIASLNRDPVVLLGDFLSDDDSWMLASIHPLLRDRAWTFSLPETLSRDDLGLAIVMFPQSDILTDAVPEFVVNKWKEAVLDFIAHEIDLEPFLTSLVSSISSAIVMQEERGFPARVKRYRDVLKILSKNYEEYVHVDIDEWLEDAHIQNQIPKTPSSDLAIADPVMFDAEEVESIAYGFLRDAGSVHTINTSILAVSPIAVEVEEMIFGGYAYNFTFNIDTREVFDITRDGTIFPLPLPLWRFSEWAGKI